MSKRKGEVQFELVLKHAASDEEEKEPREFTGLSNQGATCYMNSLLQTLYMTCEFRQQLFRWQFNPAKHGRKQDCIPYQLQLLFSRLQTGRTKYVETTGLTKSFQWDSHDSFEQHDVQEFCRVLFEAIETSVIGTAQEHMITSLYEGTLEDYVRCQTCGYESKRVDKFMDLSLTVRNDFDKVYNESVEKAIENYTNEEKLTGDNQYFCQQCNAKSDACKGLKLKTLPHVLMLQLKRFDLDYETMQRKKLNDKVTFPLILNLNPFISGRKSTIKVEESDSDREETEGNSVKSDPVTSLPPAEGLDMAYKSTLQPESVPEDSEKVALKPEFVADKAHKEREALRLKAKNEDLIERYRQEGPDVYELFSILIHSGSALGGHYYAYIKNWENDCWYNFNDSSVKAIDAKSIKKTFGGEGKHVSGANAYLLVYRRIRPDNIKTVDASEIPDYIQTAVNEEKARSEQDAKKKDERKAQATVKVFYKGQDRVMTLPKDESIRDVKTIFMHEFGLVDIRPEDVRLRDYQVHLEKLTDCLDDDLTLSALQYYNYKPLALEVKRPEDTFAPYDPHAIFLKINLWTPSIAQNDHMTLTQKTTEPLKIEVQKKTTIEQLMTKLQQITNIPIERMKLMRKSYVSTSHSVDVISSPSNREKPLDALRIFDASVFYLEDMEKPMSKSKWEEEMEKDQHRFVLKFNHPDEEPNAVGQIDYKYSVVVDSRKPLSVLKCHIASQLQLDVDNFLIKRGSRHGTEMKDLEIRITQSNLINGGVVYVEKGRPSLPDENKLRFFLATEMKKTELDGVWNEFWELADIAISENDSVKHMKEVVCAKVNSLYPTMQLDPTHIRIREKTNDRLGKTLHSKESLRNMTLFEKKQMCIQRISDPGKEPTERDILLSVRMWRPSTWELTPVSDLVIAKTASMRDLGEKLSEAYGIPLERIEGCRISYTWNFVRGDLLEDTWHKLGGNKLSLSLAPWYLSMDGTLIM